MKTVLTSSLFTFTFSLALAAVAHDIIPTPQSYAEGEGFNANGKIEYVTDKSVAPEGYALSVTPEKIVVAASDEAGRFYAAQTLAQMKTEKGCWAEFIRSPDDLEWKIWPRALALSDSLWKHGGNPISGRYADFRRRTLKHIQWLRDHGVNCASLNDLY